MANIIPLPTPTFNGIQPQTQGPAFGLANSIDALFNAYQQAKVQNALLPGQVQAQDLANQGAQFGQDVASNQYMAANGGFNPAQVGQGFNDLQNGQGQPSQSLYAPQQAPQGSGVPQMQPQGQPQAPQGGPGAVQGGPGLFGHATAADAAAHLMQIAQASQRMGAETAQAGLEDTQAKSFKTNEEARRAQIENGILGGNGGASGLAGAVEKSMREGKMAPDALNGLRGDMGQMLRLGITGDMARAGDNVVALQNAADKSNTTAKAEGGPEFQAKIRTARSIIADANVLKDISASLKSSDYQLINKFGLAVAAQKGSVAAQELLDQSNIVADRFQALIGGGSDAKLELGQNLFSAAKTDKQLARGIARISESLNNYASSLSGKGTTASDIVPAGKDSRDANAIIKEGLSSGKSRAEIKAELKAAGH